MENRTEAARVSHIPAVSVAGSRSDLLSHYEERCRAVRDLVHYVLTNDDRHGFYTWGPPGVGKTTGIEGILKEMKVTPIVYRGSMTSSALFNEARTNPDGVLWINDDRGLLKDTSTAQYLLAMLAPTTIDGQPKRLVTKSRAREKTQTFEFRGKLIFDSNYPVAKSGGLAILDAVRDRLEVHPFESSNEELAAVIRYLAEQSADIPSTEYPYIQLAQDQYKYWRATSVEQRGEIADFIISKAKELEARLSLRMLPTAVQYYVAQQEHGYSLDWRERVVGLMEGGTGSQQSKPLSPTAERLAEQRAYLKILLEDAEDFAKRDPTYSKADVQNLWCEAMDANDRQFRRRLNEMPKELRDVYDGLRDGRNR